MPGSSGTSRPPYVGPTGDYHSGNEALERAEFEAGLGSYNKKSKRDGLLDRIKAIFRPRPR